LYASTQLGTPPLDVYRLEARADDTVAFYAEGLLIGTAAIPAALSASTNVGMGIHAQTLTNAVGNWTVYAGPQIHGATYTGSWCWFGEPRAVSASGKTWAGLVMQDYPVQNHGAINIVQIDHSTGASLQYTLISGVSWPDDHNVPGLLIRPDGRLVAFYCQHIDQNGIRYRVSVNPYDASAWGAETIFAVPYTGTGTCYPSPVMLSGAANTVYVFFRDGDNNWSYVKSTDLATVAAPASDGAAQTAATWSVLTVAIPTPGGPSTKGIYCRQSSNGVDRIDFTATYAQAAMAGTKVDVRHAYLKAGVLYQSGGQAVGTSTGLGSATTTTFTASAAATSIVVASATGLSVGMPAISNGYLPSGTTIASIAGTTITLSSGSTVLNTAAAVSIQFIPYVFGNLTPIATSGAPDSLGDVWVQDTARNPNTGYAYVLFTQFLSPTQHQYWYARWDGVSWSKYAIAGALTGSLTPAATTTEGYYSPGAALDPVVSGVAYLSLGNAAGTACNLYRYITSDGGVTWTSQQISPPSISGATYAGQDFRPYVPRNRDPRAGVLWLRGRYNYYTYDATQSTYAPGGSFHSELMTAPF
jgi:hypothetical protein